MKKGTKPKDHSIRVSHDAYVLLLDIQSFLIKEKKMNPDQVSFKKIIEEALKVYYKNLTGKDWSK